DLLRQGLPVKMVYLPPDGVTHLGVISTKIPYINFAKRIAHGVWSTKPGMFVYYLVVVDEDVDITNIGEVIHTISSRLHPDRGIYKVPHSPGYPIILPFLSPAEKMVGDAAYVLFDCTWPKDWKPEDIPVKASFDVLWPKEIQKMVLENWETKYGYKL
ncbi:MAG: UbiD family decarboxylase, partial [Thermodesulfobacteriota bacterium]|nr:UbiD family decarboxylase [Thermodesulfobacteriota bacterium]